MPSPIGHGVAGLIVAWTGAPDRRPFTRLAWLCAALAALADADLLFPGPHRAYTHSVGAVLLVIIVAAAVTRWVTPRSAGRLTVVLATAYASHVLLDWLAADDSLPYGIRALWPFSDQWYISGWDVFAGTARIHLFSRATMWHNVQAVRRELLLLGPVAAGVYVARFFNSPGAAIYRLLNSRHDNSFGPPPRRRPSQDQ